MKAFASIKIVASLWVLTALIRLNFAAFWAMVRYAQRLSFDLFVGKSHLVGLHLIVLCLIADVFCVVGVLIASWECSFKFRSRYEGFGREFAGVKQWAWFVCLESESSIGLELHVVWKMVSLVTLATLGPIHC